jgi:hypothetical protein
MSEGVIIAAVGCRLRVAGCSFIVAGRKDAVTGLFKQLSDVQVSITDAAWHAAVSGAQLPALSPLTCLHPGDAGSS